MAEITETSAPDSAAIHKDNLSGILAILAGTIFFTLNDSIVKLLGQHLPPGEIMALRGSFATSLLLAACLRFGALTWRPGTLHRPAFWLRLIGELGATVTFVVALMHMQFADISGILQFQPLSLTAASALFLAEPVGLRRWVAAAAGFVGVLLIIRPGGSAFEPFALMAIACVLFSTLRDLSTRLVPAGTPALLMSLCSALVVTAFGFMMRIGETWVAPAPMDWFGLVATATLIFAGYLLVTIAVRIGELSVVSPFRYAGVIFAVALQVAIWGIAPDAATAAGIVVVVLAGLYTFHREQVRLHAVLGAPSKAA